MPTTDYAEAENRVRLARAKAELAIGELMDEQLQVPGLSESEKAHFRARWMNPRKAVDRLLTVSLWDRLGLSGW